MSCTIHSQESFQQRVFRNKSSYVVILLVYMDERPFNSGVDVSGPSLFSHWHVWHPAGSALPEGVFGKQLLENRGKRTCCAHGLE